MPRKKKITPDADVKISGRIRHGKKAMRNADLPQLTLSDFIDTQLHIEKLHAPVPAKPQERLKKSKQA